MKTFFYLCFALISLRVFATPLSIQEIAEKTIPATVFVGRTTNSFEQSYGSNPAWPYEYLRSFYEWYWPSQYGHGSGFIIHPDGYVVTNSHVVKDGTGLFVAIQSQDLRIYKATLVGLDERSDIAVIKIENPQNVPLPSLNFADSHAIKIGDPVIAIGNPASTILESTVTHGIVSATDRNICFTDIEGFIQIDAAINSGNSGGPLLNLQGEVIGVNACTLFHHKGWEGLAFAIPSHTAKEISQQLIAKGKITQGYLGVELEYSEESIYNVYYFYNHEGALVEKVEVGSPAEKGGLQKDDLIIAVNGNRIKSAHGLRNEIWILEPSTTVQLTVQRDDNVVELTVTLGSKESPSKSTYKI